MYNYFNPLGQPQQTGLFPGNPLVNNSYSAGNMGFSNPMSGLTAAAPTAPVTPLGFDIFQQNTPTNLFGDGNLTSDQYAARFEPFDGGQSGWNMDKVGQAVGIGADVLGAVLAFQQLGLAKDVFNEQRAMGRANLNNQVATMRSNADDTNAARLRRAANNNINPNNVNTIDLSGLKTLGG